MVRFLLLAMRLALTAQPALANYPCPVAPDLENSRSALAVAAWRCRGSFVATGGGSDSSGGGYAPAIAVTAAIFCRPCPPSYDAMSIAINEAGGQKRRTQKQMQEAKQTAEAGSDPSTSATSRVNGKSFRAGRIWRPETNCVGHVEQGGWCGRVLAWQGLSGRNADLLSTDFPPRRRKPSAVTLKQSKYQPQSVNALNFSVPNIPAGALGLTVPNIDAALNTMLDVGAFRRRDGWACSGRYRLDRWLGRTCPAVINASVTAEGTQAAWGGCATRKKRPPSGGLFRQRCSVDGCSSSVPRVWSCTSASAKCIGRYRPPHTPSAWSA